MENNYYHSVCDGRNGMLECLGHMPLVGDSVGGFCVSNREPLHWIKYIHKKLPRNTSWLRTLSLLCASQTTLREWRGVKVKIQVLWNFKPPDETNWAAYVGETL